jgi:drug/metabolite transporter (DMT)-like permease
LAVGATIAAPPAAPRAQWAGTGMVLVSATAFGTLAIFAKLGYASGLGTEQTLAFRFLLAAIGMIALALVLGQNPMRLRRNQLLTLFGLGAIVYTGQSLTYFIALRSLPASLVVLIAYIYPSLVVVAGWLFLRRAISAWHGIALAMSFLGVALLVGGAQFHLSWALVLPLILAIASPTIYTGYILIGERVMTSVLAVAASAVIMSGAALAFCLLAALNHELALPRNAGGWAVAVGIALVPTMIAISLFLAGLPRIGAARAALLSTWEPVVTVFLAVLVLADRLSLVQVLGGVLVIVAVIVVQATHLWRPGLPNALK